MHILDLKPLLIGLQLVKLWPVLAHFAADLAAKRSEKEPF